MKQRAFFIHEVEGGKGGGEGAGEGEEEEEKKRLFFFIFLSEQILWKEGHNDSGTDSVAHDL